MYDIRPISADIAFIAVDIGVNHGEWGCIPQKFTVGDGIITISQYGWLTGHNRHT